MIALAFAIAVLGGGGVYLLIGRRLFEAILGASLLAHAANLLVLAGAWRPDAASPLHGGGVPVEAMADPLPQAMVLTAIVISMALTLYLLALLVARGDEPSRAGSEESP